MRDMRSDRRLDATADAPREAIGAVGAGEIEPRRGVLALGSTRARAPSSGGACPGARLLHPTGEASALAGGDPDRERGQHCQSRWTGAIRHGQSVGRVDPDRTNRAKEPALRRGAHLQNRDDDAFRTAASSVHRAAA